MQDHMDYLRHALPETDLIALDDAFLKKVVDHAAKVRKAVSWGRSIPEDVFKAFVLFPRVNNERLVFYQEILWNALKPRIDGKSMTEAAMEVNIWCAENASYHSTDIRTADALTVLRRTFGRCGEESTLLTSALRSVGIPARQVYVPRWSHCDDNHAWVEAWADGQWHYMGACEPEPVLDSGWFTAAASRAMLVHTRAYGLIPEGERVEQKIGTAYLVNRTAAYAKTRILTVQVTRQGHPVADATVRFELANLGEFYPINTQITDANGETSLLTGLGTLHLHVHHNGRFCQTDVDVLKTDRVEVKLEDAVSCETEVRFYRQHPPEESRMQPMQFAPEVLARHAATLANCAKMLNERRNAMLSDDPNRVKARGNWDEIRTFLQDIRFDDADKHILLDTLTEKDWIDVTHEVLSDALKNALRYRKEVPEGIWRESILCPRVSNEPLKPHHAILKNLKIEGTDSLSRAQSLWRELKKNFTLIPSEPPIAAPADTYRAMKGSDAALDILFIAAARSLGIAARLNPASGEKEVYSENGYLPILPKERESGTLTLTAAEGQNLVYGTHYSIGILENGAYRTLTLPEVPMKGSLTLKAAVGQYRILTCTRQIDGRMDIASYPVSVRAGEETELCIELPPDHTAQCLLNAELPPLPAVRGELPSGQPVLLALLAPGEEPSEHFLNEVETIVPELRARNILPCLAVQTLAAAENVHLQRTLTALGNAVLLVQPDDAALMQWRVKLRAGEMRLPLVAALDAQGRGLFAFANYNVGSAQALLRVFDAAGLKP